jgi:hypothetical protein
MRAHFEMPLVFVYRVKPPSELPYTNIVDEIKKFSSQESLPSSEEIGEILGNILFTHSLFKGLLFLLVSCI